MRRKKQLTITRILNENDELENEYISQMVILFPDNNEKIKNIITGEIIDGIVAVGNEDSIENYEGVLYGEN